ncbi:MAG: flagellar motor protein MotA [Alphaproteobacteria bacterium]|nr:flagellar motor protein MotA [Alphaproteobacteria bacterium]
MTRPQKYLVRMAAFVFAVVLVVAALANSVWDAFAANVALNGLILGVFLFGVVYVFRQVIRLAPEARWIEVYRRNEPGLSVPPPPTLLAPMASMLGERIGRISLSATSLRSLLDTISSRLDESREISRYMIGLLIFLGLLGTFWGLIQTMGSLNIALGKLSIASGDVQHTFKDLQSGLRAPLSGMGTAFSASLFGLAGSLVLGFLDLQAGQAQNRFYNELEEWLSSVTHLSRGSVGDGDQSFPAYVSALLEQSAESLAKLQRVIARGEEGRLSANQALLTLTDRLSVLSDQMRAEQGLIVRLAEAQTEIKPLMQRMVDTNERAAAGGLMHLKNLDVYVMRLLEETTAGRKELIEEFRSEVKLLARTVATAIEHGTRQH